MTGSLAEKFQELAVEIGRIESRMNENISLKELEEKIQSQAEEIRNLKELLSNNNGTNIFTLDKIILIVRS